MKYGNPLLFALPIALLSTASVVRAEDKAPAAATVRCRVFAITKAPPGDVYVKVAGKYQRIVISKDYVGASVRLDAKDGIVFYRKVEAAAKPGEPKEKERYEPFASCAPDGAAPRQLVFLAPTGDTWRAMAKSDVDAAFPLGTRLFFNLSNTAVGIDFGGTKLVLKGKQSGLLHEAQQAPEGLARVRMVRQASSGEWIPFLSSVWRQTTDERTIMLIYPVQGSDEVAFSCVPDRIEPKDELEKKADPKKK